MVRSDNKYYLLHGEKDVKEEAELHHHIRASHPYQSLSVVC